MEAVSNMGISPSKDWLVRASNSGPWIVFMKNYFAAAVDAEKAKRKCEPGDTAGEKVIAMVSLPALLLGGLLTCVP